MKATPLAQPGIAMKVSGRIPSLDLRAASAVKVPLHEEEEEGGEEEEEDQHNSKSPSGTQEGCKGYAHTRQGVKDAGKLFPTNPRKATWFVQPIQW